VDGKSSEKPLLPDMKRDPKPYGFSDVVRFAAQTDTCPSTVQEVLNGGHVRSRARQRIYRALVEAGKGHWIASPKKEQSK
jgi:hypothetical protein